MSSQHSFITPRSFVLNINRAEIEDGDLTELEVILKIIVSEPAKTAGKVDFFVTGYESDPRDVWEIEEVRR